MDRVGMVRRLGPTTKRKGPRPARKTWITASAKVRSARWKFAFLTRRIRPIFYTPPHFSSIKPRPTLRSLGSRTKGDQPVRPVGTTPVW